MHLLLHPRLADCRRIFLKNCEMSVRIGVHDHEKKEPQRMRVSVDLFVPLNASTPRDDELAEVVDYSLIRETLDEIVRRGHINLQETFCDEIARLLLAHTDIRAVRVATEKTDVYDDAESIGVEIFRIRPEEIRPPESL